MTPAMFWRHRYQDEVDRQESGQTKPPENSGRFRLKKLGIELLGTFLDHIKSKQPWPKA